MLPAASTARARKVVLESSGTETWKPGEAKVAAVPVATRFAALQSAVVAALKSRTVEPDAALPRTRGELLVAGEAGLVAVRVGAAGGVESSTYTSELDEQAELAPLIARARKRVVESLGTETWMPGDANSAAVPVARRVADVQSAVVGAA